MAFPPRKLCSVDLDRDRPAALEPRVRVREDARQRRSAPSEELLFSYKGLLFPLRAGRATLTSGGALTLSGLRMRYLFEDYALDTDRRELCRRGDVVRLEPQAFDLLEYLIRNRERVVSRDDLIAAVWGGRIVSDLAMTTRINAARCAIGDTGKAQRLIKTVPRKGIRFVGRVREERPAVASDRTPARDRRRPTRASLTSPRSPFSLSPT